MKLHKIAPSSSASEQTIFNNLQSQTAWVGQKYFGADSLAGENTKLRYGHAFKQPKDGDEISIQLEEQADFASLGHEVPLSS
jgi:hypothetical protein